VAVLRNLEEEDDLLDLLLDLRFGALRLITRFGTDLPVTWSTISRSRSSWRKRMPFVNSASSVKGSGGRRKRSVMQKRRFLGGKEGSEGRGREGR
jgi:hypothetical protein